MKADEKCKECFICDGTEVSLQLLIDDFAFLVLKSVPSNTKPTAVVRRIQCPGWPKPNASPTT